MGHHIEETNFQTAYLPQKLSMLSVEPIWTDFLFAAIYCDVDLYSIIRIEPMHNISLAISMLKECVWDRLGDDYKETCAIKKVSGSGNLFKSVTKVVLLTLNSFSSFLAKTTNMLWDSAGF